MLFFKRLLVLIFGVGTMVGAAVVAWVFFSDPFIQDVKTFRLGIWGVTTWIISVLGLWGAALWLWSSCQIDVIQVSDCEPAKVPSPSNGVGYVRPEVVDHLLRANNDPPGK